MSTNKKWLIGCSGCLGVLLILTLIATAVGIGCWNQLQTTSNQTVENIFGSQPPGGYTSIGIPIPDKSGKKNSVVLMIHPDKKVVLAVDSIVPESDAQVLRSGDPKAIEGFLCKVAAKNLESATAKSGKGMKMKNLHLEGQEQIKLSNGKTFPVVQIKIENEGEFSPAAAGLIMKPNNELVMLLAMEPTTSSTDSETNFKSSYDKLTSEITTLVSETALDDQLVSH